MPVLFFCSDAFRTPFEGSLKPLVSFKRVPRLGAGVGGGVQNVLKKRERERGKNCQNCVASHHAFFDASSVAEPPPLQDVFNGSDRAPQGARSAPQGRSVSI